MDHCPSMMVKASGDRLGFLLILKMQIVNVFLREGRLLANLFKDAIACTLKILWKTNRDSMQVPAPKESFVW